jgi:hypothetical protein
MVDFPLRLPTESTIGRSGQEAHTRLINGYPEATGEDGDGKAAFCVYARPGLIRFSQNSLTAPTRGFVLGSGDTTLIAVIGGQALQYSTAGAATYLAAVAGSDRVTAALNQNSTPQVAIVNDGGTYWNLIPSAPSISNPSTGFSAPNSVTYLKGFFIFSTVGGTIFHSAINDGTTFNALSYGLAGSDSGALVRGIADAGYYYVFGDKIFEIWQVVGTSPFALAPTQQYIPMGLLAKYSIAKGAANGLVWVDHRGIVRYGRDGGALRLSTHTIERAIEELPDTDRPNLSGCYFTAQGHEFYCLSAPSQWSWVCDITMQRWFEWNSNGLALNRWIVNDAIPLNEHWVVSDYRNGLLYQVDADEFDDIGNEFIFDLWCPHVHAFGNSLIADQLDIDIASGTGLLSGTSDDESPQLQISYSDDGGSIFKGERYTGIGAAGQRSQLVRTNSWGRVNPKGRIWRIRASARVLRSVIQAQIGGRRLSS